MDSRRTSSGGRAKDLSLSRAEVSPQNSKGDLLFSVRPEPRRRTSSDQECFDEIRTKARSKRRNLDRINRMNRMYGGQNRSLSSDHPVNPVHPVQSLSFGFSEETSASREVDEVGRGRARLRPRPADHRVYPSGSRRRDNRSGTGNGLPSDVQPLDLTPISRAIAERFDELYYTGFLMGASHSDE